jgi:putative FmdB family regulatory protein
LPTYSYRCTECATAFDIQQAFTDDSLTECPACNGRLRKLFSAVGVTFSGSGFYRNDSRAAAKKEGGSSSSSSSSAGESSTSTSTATPAPAAAAATGSASSSKE